MGKRIITEADVERLAKDGVVEVVRGMVVTPLARDHASRKGIRLVYGGGSVPSAEDIPRDPVTGRKGPDARGPDARGPDGKAAEDGLRLTVAEEVARAIAEAADTHAAAAIPSYSPLAEAGVAGSLAEAAAGEPARALVVATGVNHPGVAAALTSSISECGADIQDISQTLVAEFFSMIFVVSLSSLGGGLTFRDFKERVEAAGRGAGAEVVVFHEQILNAMHRV
ncbi:MAG: hypothetical protein FJ087_05755 [Deltaproteobacteria bacterium]|nr:hypothetical protein [Deltaproteobacteria bacterium]